MRWNEIRPLSHRCPYLVLLIGILAGGTACVSLSHLPPAGPNDPASSTSLPEPPTWVAMGADKKSDDKAEAGKNQDNEADKKKGPSGAMQALQFWGAQRAYPFPKIPDGKYGAALEQVREMQGSESRGLQDLTGPWEALGPANIGGRTLCLALHPDDPDIIFAGSASGGLWKTTTGGVGADAWDYVDTGYPVLGVSTIAIDPNDTDVMYIGTGEAYDYEETMGGEAVRVTRGSYGVGILKTVDGGANWTPSLDWTYQQSRGVWMVQIHPVDSDVLYAATTEGIYKSIDAGALWTRVHDVIMAMDVRIHPLNPDIVLSAHGNFASAGHGIYRSSDAGETWGKVTAGLPSSWTGKTQLAISPTAPDTVFASIADEDEGRGLYRSTDAGVNWTLINSINYQQYQGWYSHYVIVSPFDSQNLFTGGIEIWRSTSGGVTLTRMSNWQEAFFGTPPPEGPIGGPNYAHADHHFAVWHPTEPNTVFFASDGGVFRTTDLGENFESLIGGYQTTQFYNGFSNSGSDPDFAIGGLQDNFTAIYEGGNAWRRVIGGDGSWTAINPLASSTVYGSYQYLNIRRSSNFGNNWSTVTPPEHANDYTAFIGPYVLCPDQPSVLYAGRSRVYRTDSEGSNWDATNGGAKLENNSNPAISLAVAKQSPDTAYAGTAPIFGRARVFATHDGGDDWIDVTADLPDRYPSDFAVDPNDANKVFVTFMGFGTSHVFKSIDGGDSWIDIGNGLPDIPTTAVAVDPDHPDIVYVGTDLGVFFSIDAGSSWQPFSDGMPLAMVNDLKIFLPGRKIRAATHGNGAWERDLFEPCVGPDADSDGVCDDVDCAPGNPRAWLHAGDVRELLLSHVGGAIGSTTLEWNAPAEPGGSIISYDTASSLAPDDFELDPSVSCVESNDGTDTVAVDVGAPDSGETRYFLVRAENACGPGSAGTDSLGSPRSMLDCP